MRVIYRPAADGRKKSFFVCTRGLMFKDSSIIPRVIEWIELLCILGAEKIFLYYYEVSPELLRTLRHYEKRGVVDLTRMTFAGFYERWEKALPSIVQTISTVRGSQPPGLHSGS